MVLFGRSLRFASVLAVAVFLGIPRSNLSAPSQNASFPANSSMADYDRAWVLVGQDRADEAISLLKKIIARDEAFYRAYWELVEAYETKRDFAGARDYFESLARSDASNAVAYYGLGLAATRRADTLRSHENGKLTEQGYRLAASYFRHCIQMRPSAYFCYAPLAYALWNTAPEKVGEPELLRQLGPRADPEYKRLALAKFHLDARVFQAARDEADAGLEQARQLEQHEIIAEFLELGDGARGQAYRLDSELLARSQEDATILQQLGDWPQKLEAEKGVAELYYRMGEMGDALAHRKAILDWTRAIENPKAEAETLSGIGRDYVGLGQLLDALHYASEAADLMRKRNSPDLASFLEQLGTIYRMQGDYDDAIAMTQAALAVDVRFSNSAGEAFLRRDLGVLYGEVGDYIRELDYGKQSVRIFQQLHWYLQAGAGLSNVGIAYERMGDYSHAIALGTQSLQSAVRRNSPPEQQRNLANLGFLYLEREEPKTALGYFERAARFSASVRSRQNDALLGIGFGDAYVRQGSYPAALAKLDAGMAAVRELHDRPLEAQALIELGDCYLRMRDWANAQATFSKALSLGEEMGLKDVIVAARRGLGQVLRNEGDLQGALRELEPAVDMIETMRAQIKNSDLASSFMQDNWKVYEDLIYVLSLLYDRVPDGDYDRLAFDYAERGRARSFLDMLGESQNSITKGLAPSQVKQQRNLLGQLSQASAKAITDPSPENRAAVDAAARRVASWSVELAKTNPSYQQLRYPKPLTIEQVRSQLVGDGQTAVLEYALGEDRSCMWLVTNTASRMVTLPPQRVLSDEVNALRNMIGRRPQNPSDYRNYGQLAHQLYRQLVQPVANALSGRQTLIIVPDGILHYLPFEVLTEDSEAPSRKAGASASPRYLVEDYSIEYAPSTSVLAELNAARSASKSPSSQSLDLLAYGDPVFGAPEAGIRGDVASLDAVRGAYKGAGFALSPLPNTRIEVENIGALFPPPRRRLYLGSAATKASFESQDLAAYKFLHIATHAVIDENVPAMSGIVFSLTSHQDDGVLRMSDVFNLNLDSDLVVLSACETGLGKLVRGEGMIGLTRAFLYAGARRVAVSLWPVNDVATAKFMQGFYRAMADGMSPSRALQQAKLEMIRSDIPSYGHPYFWAPFVLVGSL